VKTSSSSCTCRLLRQVALAFVLGIVAAPAARAGLTMEMDLVLENNTYSFSPNLGTNATAPAVPFGNYFVASPGYPADPAYAQYHFDTNGFNQVGGSSSYGFSDFDATNFNDSFIQNITNGQWSIFVTNSVVTNVYHFTVTASIGSNSMPPVVILYPPNNALNVTNQPTFLWQGGPTNYSDLILYQGPNNTFLPVTQTSYSGFTAAAGLDGFNVHYDLFSSNAVVSSVPTNSASSPLSSWVSTAHLQDLASSQFTVGSPVANFNADLNTTNLPWATMGDAAWFTETTNTYNGAPAAAQSGSVTGSQASTLSVIVNGPGTLTFFWSSIANDPSGGFSCEFDVDGNYSNNIIGDTAWVQDGPYSIGPGQHTLSWTVFANGDTDPTQAGFLDNVSYVPASSPTLTVTAAPSSGLAPLAVQFTSPVVDSFGHTVTNWNWTFGDGGTSMAQSPMHSYTNAGSYSPSLTAYSTYGSSPIPVTGLGTITVTNPTLNVTVTPPSGVAPLTVQFTSPGVDSGGNTVTNWNWNFGDGGNSTAQNPSHIYTGIGSFSPGLVARSTQGTSPLAVTGLGGINVYSNPIPAFHTLYTFSTNFGAGPNPVIVSGNKIYGTTVHGGISSLGTVFAINTDGTGFTNLYNNFISSFINGGDPSSVILSGGNLYGTTAVGGNGGGGTVFAVNTNGTGFTNLYSNFNTGFAGPGSQPVAGVAISSNTLYGLTEFGGSHTWGTIFSISTNGSNFGDLYSFDTPAGNNVNFAGLYPQSRLVVSGTTLYGTAENGGANAAGTVFAFDLVHGFSILHNFTATVNGTNSDGAFPFKGLVLSGNILYGVTPYGGATGNGVVYAVSTNGLFFTNLYNFTGGNDGANPQGGLTISGNTLYGSAGGGSLSNGTLFSININGSGFTNLYNFNGGSDGANPAGDLFLAGNVLYGSAGGGSSGNGTLFSFTLPRPLLAIARSGTNAILTWSASASGYTLEFATNLVSPAVWNTNLPAPVVLSGLNTVTNPIATSPKFYRLTQ
jgi:uncharacterized repeat protein (TIGR03803 family)